MTGRLPVSEVSGQQQHPVARFDRFARADDARTRAQGGVGLGLAICQRSVEANNGELRVRDLPGSGCIFTIDLPRLVTA